MNFRFTYISPSVFTLTGYTPEEFIDLALDRVVPPASLELIYKVFEEEMVLEASGQADPGRTRALEVGHVRKDGSAIQIELNMSALRDQNGLWIGILGVTRDITDRKRVEMEREQTLRQLARSQAILRSIIEFLPEATVVIDNEGRVLEWNRAMEDLAGVPAGDILGRGDHEYAVALYDDRRPMLIDVALHPELKDQTGHSRIMSFGNVLYTEAMKPAGQRGDLYLTAAAATLHDAAGNVIGAVETIRDETERRNLERQLQQSEKMVSLGRISAGVAHEILNPVGIISLELQLLHTMHDMPEAAREELDVCAKQVERIVSITNDLRQLTRSSC